MRTESQVGSHKRVRASLTVVKPSAYPKINAHEALATAENETGGRHRPAWRTAVTALCLLWLCLNAIPASAHMDLHVWLNLIAAVVLAFSGVWSRPNQDRWLCKRIALLPEETNVKATEDNSPLRRRLPSRSLKPTSVR
jgi:hypothetical protein